MAADEEFLELLEKVRCGDPAATTLLVQRFEPEVRRFIRFRLSSPALRRTFDSLDICQSVLCRFFVDISEGRLELNDPRQLTALLLTMARNKLCDKVRQAHSDRQDIRRQEHVTDETVLGIADSADTPSEIVGVQEILNAVRQRLTEEERFLVDQRLAGRGWQELAEELGDSVDTLRKRMTRSIDTAAAQLGLRSAEQ